MSVARYLYVEYVYNRLDVSAAIISIRKVGITYYKFS